MTQPRSSLRFDASSPQKNVHDVLLLLLGGAQATEKATRVQIRDPARDIFAALKNNQHDLAVIKIREDEINEKGEGRN